MSLSRPRLSDWLTLVLIAIAAAGVRVALMTDWLGYDECQALLVTKSPFLTDFAREFRIRAHPPLMYVLLKPFLSMGTSAAAARGLSLSSGLLAIPIIYLTLRSVLRSRAAIAAGTFFLAMVPVFVEQSIELRGYSLSLVFVWWSLLLVVRMGPAGIGRPRDHVLLAVALLLAIATEYSAIFHAAALAAVVYVPMAVRAFRGDGWGRLVKLTSPHLLLAAFAFVLFDWHFRGRVPSFGHTRPHMYSGELSEVGAVLGFLFDQFSRFAGDVLPRPWGFLAIAASLLPLVFAPRGGERSALGRSLASYSLLAILLISVASLLGYFPFGSTARHYAPIVPGVLVSAHLAIVGIALRAAAPGLPRRAAAAALALAVLPGVLLGLLPHREEDRREVIRSRIGAHEFADAPGPVFTSWRGRNFVTWWLLPEGPVRLIEETERYIEFDHGGHRVFQYRSLEELFSSAVESALQNGRSWIFLAFLKGEREREVHSWLDSQIRRDHTVQFGPLRRGRIDFPTITMRIDARPAPILGVQERSAYGGQ